MSDEEFDKLVEDSVEKIAEKVETKMDKIKLSKQDEMMLRLMKKALEIVLIEDKKLLGELAKK